MLLEVEVVKVNFCGILFSEVWKRDTEGLTCVQIFFGASCAHTKIYTKKICKLKTHQLNKLINYY